MMQAGGPRLGSQACALSERPTALPCPPAVAVVSCRADQVPRWLCCQQDYRAAAGKSCSGPASDERAALLLLVVVMTSMDMGRTGPDIGTLSAPHWHLPSTRYAHAACEVSLRPSVAPLLFPIHSRQLSRQCGQQACRLALRALPTFAHGPLHCPPPPTLCPGSALSLPHSTKPDGC